MAEKAPALEIVQIVADYHVALYRYAYRLTGSVQDAEDLTQQVFLIAQQKADQVRGAECVSSWLYAVLRNSYLKGFRRRFPALAGNIDLDIESLPAEVFQRDIDVEQLQRAIDELSDEFKLVVLLFYFEQCSYREIAAKLELPLGTVMSRLSRAKQHLRRKLLTSDEPPEKQRAAGAPAPCGGSDDRKSSSRTTKSLARQ